jgi:hypothetical protein
MVRTNAWNFLRENRSGTSKSLLNLRYPHSAVYLLSCERRSAFASPVSDISDDSCCHG